MYYSSSVFGIALVALNPLISIVEPDEGMNATVRSCFQANVTQTRATDTVFQFNLLSTSTAGQMCTFVNDAPTVVIPARFSGMFSQCVNVTIIGDDVVEEDERIKYEVQPLYERDYVQSATNPLVIVIIDNDGE